MNYKKELLNILRPLVYGAPISIFLISIAFIFAKRSILYSNEKFQASGSIKVDTRSQMQDVSSLFNKKESAVKESNFMTEVEVFKSRSLIRATMQKLDFQTTYYRVGKLKTKELYHDSPFSISYNFLMDKDYGKNFFLKYVGGNQFQLIANEKATSGETIYVNEEYCKANINFTVVLNEIVLQKPECLKAGDLFSFKIQTLDQLASEVNENNYFVRPVDKEINIVKVYYEHEIADKAALFVNTLLQTYIYQQKYRETNSASKSLDFVDNQLQTVASKLRSAESKLAGFKAENGIVNALQETDATLKSLMQLNIKEVNYNIQKAELERIFAYLSTGKILKSFSPNFEALNGAIFKESYLKAQKFELDKQDLLLTYTENSEEVAAIDGKIATLRNFIHESVRNSIENISAKSGELNKAIAEANTNIKGLPKKQKDIASLEREVKLNEELYTYLVEKKTELAISGTAINSYHQIIDTALIPKKSIWPNKPLFYGVSIFFAMLLGVLFSYVWFFINARVKDKKDVTEMCTLPNIAKVRKLKRKEKYSPFLMANLFTNLEILMQEKSSSKASNLVVISSMRSGEGKSFTTVNLSKAIAATGKKVLLIDMDVRKPDLHNHFGISNDIGLAAILKDEVDPKDAIKITDYENLDLINAGELGDIYSGFIFSNKATDFIHQLKKYYEYIIVDTSPIGLVIDAIPLMHVSDLNILMVRAGKTKIRHLKSTDSYLEEYKIPKLYTVLNCTKQKQSSYYYYNYKNKAKEEDSKVTAKR